jgi:nucleotide-binding universal stress UspA family protein
VIEIKNILCPVDLSDFSRRALDHAVAVARWYDSTITALFVYEPVPAAAYGAAPAPLTPVVLTSSDREQMLADVTRFADAASTPGVRITTVVREGNPVREILDAAAEARAGLLVMGTHGRSGFGRLILGSVTEKVLRQARCPVLTVPRRHPDAVPAAPVLFKRIVCPVDFSKCSMRALTYALSMAQEADARLTVVHVLSGTYSDLPMMSEGDVRTTAAELQEQREVEARQLLEKAVPDAASSYCHVETTVLRGTPSQEILRIAAAEQADLIVIGVQGRSAVDLMFFGSTTQQVVREASCPVLTLRLD